MKGYLKNSGIQLKILRAPAVQMNTSNNSHFTAQELRQEKFKPKFAKADSNFGVLPEVPSGYGPHTSFAVLQKDTRGSPESIDPGDKDKKPDKSQQLKRVFKEYGAVGVSFHVGISLASLGIFYLVVSSGVDMTAILYKLGFSEAVVQSKLAAGASTFVLAYAVHKLFAPVRISITLVSVPFIVQYCRKIGFFKPPSP
ncbi:protein FAM210B, mitochondrial [Alligator sinensis]|uniref:Protein FAM210B, mitochondrial n=1 Tax=Alligator sinensis TaxID=38654 RepID=A0A1U7RSM8_ALLSI|nr:protein FAM210B, mitochondrial [Alligator sinensis]